MAQGRHVPTAASDLLTGRLRTAREQAGLTWETVAEEMGWSESKLYRIENDKSRVLTRDVTRLLRLYGVSGDKAEALLELARQAREPEWWHRYSAAIPEWFRVFVMLEGAASEELGYEPELVPGILQTEAYARAIVATAPPTVTEELIQERVAVRLGRQTRLDGQQPLRVWFVLNEAVLRRNVGGPAVMGEQVERLAALAARRNVTLQVLPFGAGAHPAMEGSFAVLRFPRDDVPDRVYVDLHVGAAYFQAPAEIERCRWVLDSLRASALSPDDTADLLRTCAVEWATVP